MTEKTYFKKLTEWMNPDIHPFLGWILWSVFIGLILEIFSRRSILDAAVFVLEMILMMIVADSCLCLQIYAALAVGHSFSHHKGLLSFAAYFGLSIAWSFVHNGALHLLNLIAPDGISLGLQNLSPFVVTHINMAAMILILMIPAAVWYAVTTWFLKNRLNLD